MEIDILTDIPDGKPVRIFLPLINATDRYRAHCVFQKAGHPKFNLLFKPGILPDDVIDVEQPCIINIDMGGPNISLEAMISEIVNSQTLGMVAKKSINHEQMREFFRVDTTTQVISKAFHPTVYGSKGKDWSYNGETIDISGSGLLANFSTQPPMDQQVTLELTLPSDEEETINILARPIRFEQISNDQFVVAYHFEDIKSEDRDKIIGCCLIIQRKILRMKVQVKGQSV